MTLSWNPAGDFADVADAVEAVTLMAVNGSETAVSEALRLRISDQEAAASGGQYTQSDVKWHLPAAEVASPPRVGATITDGQSRTWTILRVDQDTRSSRWRCWCRALALAALGGASLADRINIQQASWTKGDHGAQQPTWSDWKVNLPAAIQEVEATAVVEHDQRIWRSTHRVLVAKPLELTARLRIVQPATGETFHIIGHQPATRLGELFTIHAVRTPWRLGQP